MSNIQVEFDAKVKRCEQLLSGVLPMSCRFRSELAIKLATRRINSEDAMKQAKQYYENSTGSNMYSASMAYRKDHRIFNVYAVIKNKSRRYAIILIAPDGLYNYVTYTEMIGYIKSGFYTINNIEYSGNRLNFTTQVKELIYESAEFRRVLNIIQNHKYKLGDKL